MSLNSKRIGFFSDLHIGLHQNSEKWHDVTFSWAKWFSAQLKSQKITELIFGGDFFHYRDEINVKSLHFTNDVLDLFKDFEIVMIPGNHDAYYKDNSTVHSLSILKLSTNQPYKQFVIKRLAFVRGEPLLKKYQPVIY